MNETSVGVKTAGRTAAALAAALMGGPFLIKSALNRYLKTSPSLRGRIGGMRVNPFTGRLTASEISLVAFRGGASIASLHAVEAVVDLSLKDLARGRIVASLALTRPAVLWRVPPPQRPADGEASAPPAAPRIDRALRALPPFRIERIKIVDGEFHAQNVPGQNGTDLRLERIDVDVENFVTREDLAPTSFARGTVTAQAMDSGRIEASIAADQLAPQPLFDAALRLDGLRLPEVGSVIRHGTGADVQDGTLSVFAEASAANGAIKGYIKPMVDHLTMVRSSAGGRWRSWFARFASRALANRRLRRIATKVWFEGAVEKPVVHFSGALKTAVWNVLRKPLAEGLDGGVAATEVAREVENGRLLAPPAPPARWKIPFQLFFDSFQSWSADGGPRMGAALAYYMVFSMAPLILLAVAIAGLVFGQAAAEGQIMDSLRGVMGDQAAATVQSMVEAARKPATGIAATIVGAITLVLGASAVMNELKISLNKIWGATAKGGFIGAIKKKLLCFSAVLAIGFLMLVSLMLSAAISAAAAFVGGRLPIPAVALQALNVAATIVTIGVLFAMLYKILPDTRIEWRDVWVGSLFTTGLFVIGKQALGVYLGRAMTTSAYGAAGSVLLVLVWIYYSAQIFYLGAEFTRVFSERFGSRAQPEWEDKKVVRR